MESLGEKLRTAREEKSLSVDQVARDTNIAKRYLTALEEEAFTEFPGEPYLVGFLRNYSDYLGLDSEEIVGLYKNFKIQEQPLPMEELLETTKRRPRNLRILAVAAAVVAVAVLLYLLVPLLSSGGGESAASSRTKLASGADYTLKDEIVERPFRSGDTVIIPISGKDYRVKLLVTNNNTVSLVYAAGETTLKLGEEKSIDLTGGSVPDIKVYLRDIDLRDPGKRVVIRFDRFTESPQGPANAQAAGAQGTGANIPAADQTGAANAAGQASGTGGPQGAAGQASGDQAAGVQAASQPANAATPASGGQAGGGTQTGGAGAGDGVTGGAPVPFRATDGAATVPAGATVGATGGAGGAAAAPSNPQSPPSPPVQQAPAQPQGIAPEAERSPVATALASRSSGAESQPEILAQAGAAAPFTLTVDFSSSCLFRYQIDGANQDQRYYRKGETARLDANSSIALWASNAGALSARVAGKTLTLGSPGEVIAQRVMWVKNGSTGLYQLQLSPLE